MKNVTFRQIRVFSEVARRLSFVRAAEALHLTPPAVTMQVKDLEASIGLALFDRQGRTVSLTTTGEYFLVYARRLLSTLKDAEDAMARFKRVEAGVLNIGLVSTAKYFIPRLLARFKEEHPGIEVRLHVTGNREQLLALLHANEIDLAVMGPSGEKAPAEGGADKAAGHGGAEEKGGEHGAAADANVIADLDPFIVNLADSPEIRYLKVTLKVEADSSGTVEQIKARTPQIRDAILVLLTSLDSATARSPQGKHKLREDITERINGLLPKKSVKSTYFTEFVIQ